MNPTDEDYGSCVFDKRTLIPDFVLSKGRVLLKIFIVVTGQEKIGFDKNLTTRRQLDYYLLSRCLLSSHLTTE